MNLPNIKVSLSKWGMRWELDVRIKAEAHLFRVGIHREREIVMGDFILYPVPGSLV